MVPRRWDGQSVAGRPQLGQPAAIRAGYFEPAPCCGLQSPRLRCSRLGARWPRCPTRGLSGRRCTPVKRDYASARNHLAEQAVKTLSP